MMRVLATVALVVGLAAQSAYAQVGKSVTIVDANTIGEAELAKLPAMTPAIAKNLVAKRPFLSITALDQFLTGAGLTREQITALYGRIFIHVNLNAASREEILLIPGMGPPDAPRVSRYRPYMALAVFHREIDKYVDDAELARLEQYVFVPLDLNTASDADLLDDPRPRQPHAARIQGIPALRRHRAVPPRDRQVRAEGRSGAARALRDHRRQAVVRGVRGLLVRGQVSSRHQRRQRSHRRLAASPFLPTR